MKILVLMPLDEQHVWVATRIFQVLNKETKDITFPMPMYMEYLIQTKQEENWTYAMYNSVIAAKMLYNTAVEKNEDFILIGNCKADLKFDLIVNFQDHEIELPYEDKFLDKIRELVKDGDPILTETIADFHTTNDSVLQMKNCSATAHFLEKYIKTDPQIEQLEEDYKQKIEESRKEHTDLYEGISSVINSSKT